MRSRFLGLGVAILLGILFQAGSIHGAVVKVGTEDKATTSSSTTSSTALAGTEGVRVLPSEISELPAELQTFAREDDLRRHPLTPWYYFLWGRWHQFEHTPARQRWTFRNGRWYRSPVSNYYWQAGHWALDKRSKFHPTNPNLWRVGGEWVRKPNRYIDGRWVQGSDKRWWRSSNSNYFYRNGEWRLETKIHPTNPTLAWRGGRWVGRTLKGPQLLWVRKFGRWWKCSTCHTYYRKGAWVKLSNAEKRNNPYWRRDKGGNYVKIKPVTPKMKRFWRNPRNGVWFRSRRSNYFFRRDKWRRLNWRSNDPRWRRRNTKKRCAVLQTRRAIRRCRRSMWYRIPKKLWVNSRNEPWVKVGRRWWLDTHKMFYWHAGEWVRRKLTEADYARLEREREQEELSRVAPEPLSLRKVVNKVTKRELSQFLVWFGKSFLGPTDAIVKDIKRQKRHRYNPERSPKYSMNANRFTRPMRNNMKNVPGPDQTPFELRFPGDSKNEFKVNPNSRMVWQNPLSRTVSGPSKQNSRSDKP